MEPHFGDGCPHRQNAIAKVTLTEVAVGIKYGYLIKLRLPMPKNSIQRISVIVPKNPFAPDDVVDRQHCLTALDVSKLIEWWPGRPHVPHRNASKVRSIQRALDWNRVTNIAAYLLQDEIIDARDLLDTVFGEIYNSGEIRIWPPKVPRVVGYQRSVYPTFSNVLLHVNGAKFEANGDRQGELRI